MNLRPYQQNAVEWAKTSDGLIISPAGSGKTIIAASIVDHYVKIGLKRFGWIAPTRETCQQAHDALVCIGVPVDLVEIRCPHESVGFGNKELIVVDECKHSGAEVWKRIITSCDGLRFGFDATPWKDGDAERNRLTKELFRGRHYEIKRDEIGDSLAKASVLMLPDTDLGLGVKIDGNIEKLFRERRRYMRISDDELHKICAWESLVDIGICQNIARNKKALQIANEHKNLQNLVLVPRVALGEFYERNILGSKLVHAKVGKKVRRECMEEFRAGNLKTMIATSLADEGLDLPNVEMLIMVSGGRSSQKTIQRASRALRKTDLKDSAVIVDFLDRFHPLGEFHAKKRMKCYREIGCSIQYQ